MAARYPPYDNKIKQGPKGSPGIGFKLTNDGNYDIENKILKNCRNPLDDQDASSKIYVLDEIEKNHRKLKEFIDLTINNADISTKIYILDVMEKNYQILKEMIDSSKNNTDNSFQNFVKETSKKIQKLENDISEKYLHSQDGHVFDAKDRRIGNVKDPVEGKNVVNKRFFEKQAITLKNNVFDVGNKQISNVADPTSDMDVVNKRYVDKELFVSGSDKIDNSGYINFDKVNSYYFHENLKLKFEMTMILSLFVEARYIDRIIVYFEASNDNMKRCEMVSTKDYTVDHSYSCKSVLKGKIGDVLKVNIAIQAKNDNNIAFSNPFLKIQII